MIPLLPRAHHIRRLAICGLVGVVQFLVFFTLQGVGLALIASNGSRFADSLIGFALEKATSILGFPLFYMLSAIDGISAAAPASTNGFLIVAAANSITWALSFFIIAALLMRPRQASMRS